MQPELPRITKPHGDVTVGDPCNPYRRERGSHPIHGIVKRVYISCASASSTILVSGNNKIGAIVKNQEVVRWDRRTVLAMTNEPFGSCTNHGELTWGRSRSDITLRDQLRNTTQTAPPARATREHPTSCRLSSLVRSLLPFVSTPCWSPVLAPVTRP